MATTITSGQITIIDLYDAPVLNAWIGAAKSTRQVYNNTTLAWNPNYGETDAAQVLTLNLTKAGSADSVLANVTDVTWTKRYGNSSTSTAVASTSNLDTEYRSGTKNSVLTTKINVTTAQNSVIWEASGTWKDPLTELDVPFSASIDISLVQLAKAAVIGNIYAPNGDTFRNKTPANLKVNVDLYKDGTISAGARSYKWFAYDTKVTTVGHASYDADAGLSWRKITATTGTAGAVAGSAFDGSVSVQGVLTIFPDAVLNAQTFMCITTDKVGGTNGTKLKNFITIRDMDDPIMTVVESTGGSILKNGAGSTTLKARLYRNGAEMTASEKTGFAYKWYRIDGTTPKADWGGVGIAHKLGDPSNYGAIDITDTDVNAKSTFRVEVEK